MMYAFPALLAQAAADQAAVGLNTSITIGLLIAVAAAAVSVAVGLHKASTALKKAEELEKRMGISEQKVNTLERDRDYHAKAVERLEVTIKESNRDLKENFEARQKTIHDRLDKFTSEIFSAFAEEREERRRDRAERDQDRRDREQMIRELRERS